MNITPIFKLLSDETRLRTIMLLSQEELCVCEICGILEQPQPKVSKILSKLKDLELVTDQRKEKFIFYSIKNNNKLLSHTIKFILTEIADYPELLADQKRLKIKENYVDQCALKALKEII